MEKKKLLFFVFVIILLFGGAFFAIKTYADNTNFDLYGIGWSAHDNKGIGWVVLNSENPANQPRGTPNIPFKVSVKNKTTLEGQGWASIQDPKTGKDSYGWLSFSTNDLTGCPDKNANPGNCKATLDYASGTISGWAKFICVAGGCPVGSSQGSWDGWVSLRNDPSEAVKYGLCLGRTGTRKQDFIVNNGDTLSYITGETCQWDGIINNNQVEVSGIAWGGSSIGGWIVFGNSAPASLFGLTPAGSITLLPKEKQDFSVEKSAAWFVNNMLGGNINTVGNVSPQNTGGGTANPTTYQAPNFGGPFTVKASSTASTETGIATTTVKFPYTLTCEPSGTSTLVLTWNWSKAPVDTGHNGGYPSYAEHNISITRNGTAIPAILSNPASFSNIPGSYSDKGLSTSTKYTYVLTVKYTSDNYSTSTQVKDCQIPSAIQTTDAPSKLKAFGIDTTTIYVNWKDNTTTTSPYKFNVERIKLTPASSTDIKVLSATDSSINLEWKNNTTSTPYFNWIERSTSTSNRFLNNPAPNDAGNDKAMTKLEYSGSNSPSDGLKIYSYFNGGLQDATTYYYRVKACSTYRDSSLIESYTKEPPDLVAGKIDRPNPVCGKYAPLPNGAQLHNGTPSVATTTLPKTPTQATSTASYNKTTGVHSITIRWNDNSKRETGYQIWREGILIDERSYNTNATGTLTHIDSPTSNNKNTSALNPGTNYTYEIRGYYDIPAENGGGRVYSSSVSTNTYTYYYITVTIQNSGEGTVYGPGNLNNCTTSCEDYFSWDNVPQVQLTTSPNSDTKFTGWSGACSGTGTTCTLGRGNHDVTANFEKTIFTVSMLMRTTNATGTVRSTPAGINCTCGGPNSTCGVDGGSACNASFSAGTTITLTATTTYSNVKFASWGGSCSGTIPTCVLQLSSNVTVIANFVPAVPAVPAQIHKNSFLADLWSNARYMWKGLFVDRSQERVSALSASFLNIVKGIQDGWNNITMLFSQIMKQTEEAATKLAQETTKVAEGQSKGNPLDLYFRSVATTTAPVYVDKNLEPDTVYLYRVRAVYDGTPARITEWSNSGATKTLRDVGGGTITNRGVCTRNSYCDFSVKSYNSLNDPNAAVKMENTEQQCLSNIDCKNVGRYGQSFQER